MSSDVRTAVHAACWSVCLTFASAGAISAQAVRFEYDSATQQLSALSLGDNSRLTRGCPVTVEFTRADSGTVRGWKLTLGSSTLTRTGLGTSFAGVVPGDPGPAALTLTGAPEASSRALAGFPFTLVDKPAGGCPGIAAAAPDDTTRRVTRKQLHAGGGEAVNIYFDAFGFPRNWPRAVTDHEAINLFLELPADQDPGAYRISITGTIRGEDIGVSGAGSLGQLQRLGILHGTGEAGRAATEIYFLGAHGPYEAGAVTIEVKKLDGENEVLNRAYTVRVRRTYVASLKLAAGWSSIRFPTFSIGPRSPADTTSVIRSNADTTGRDARPYLLATFYGWRKGGWAGRDLEREPASLLDRVNPVVGIGLEDLVSEYLIGLDLELARGLSFFGAWHVARVDELPPGFALDAPFSGPPEDLPTRRNWEHAFLLGGSVDLRVAGGVIGGLLGATQ